MDFDLFVQHFVEQFDDDLLEHITADTIIRDIDGWSSYVALSIMAMVDEEYDVQLTAAEMRGTESVGQLYKLISDKTK